MYEGLFSQQVTGADIVMILMLGMIIAAFVAGYYLGESKGYVRGCRTRRKVARKIRRGESTPYRLK